MKNVDVAGGHLYGTTVSDHTNARAKGMPIWMTEYLTNITAVGSMTPWIASSNLSLAPQSPVPISDSSFSYTLPAMSVVTFFGQTDGANLNRISISSVPETGVRVAYRGISGFDYVLESTDSLIDPNWFPVCTNTADDGGVVDFTNATSGLQEFYRMRSDASSAHPGTPRELQAKSEPTWSKPYDTTQEGRIAVHSIPSDCYCRWTSSLKYRLVNAGSIGKLNSNSEPVPA